MPGSLKTEAHRAALAALRRGRPDPAPVHARARALSARSPRACGAAQSRFGGRLEPFFRAAPRLPRGARRPAHGDLRRRRSTRTRGCASTRRRSTAPRAPATRSRACSRPTSRTSASTTCSPTSSRCSTPTSAHATHANALAFRLKLLVAAGLRPALGACASCGEARAPGRLLAARPAASSAPPARRPRSRSPRTRTTSWSRALASPLAAAPRRLAARAARGRAGDRRDARAPRPPAAASGRSVTKARGTSIRKLRASSWRA